MGAVRIPSVVLPAKPPIRFQDLIQLDWKVVSTPWANAGPKGETLTWYNVFALPAGNGSDPANGFAGTHPGGGLPGNAIPIAWNIKDPELANAIVALPKVLRALGSALHMPESTKAIDLARLVRYELEKLGVRW